MFRYDKSQLKKANICVKQKTFKQSKDILCVCDAMKSLNKAIYAFLGSGSLQRHLNFLGSGS